MKRKPVDISTPKKPESKPKPKPAISRRIEANRKKIGKLKSNLYRIRDPRIQSQINRLTRETDLT